MSNTKMVSVTVKEGGKVHNGKGGKCAEGDKIDVTAETAAALKARKLV